MQGSQHVPAGEAGPSGEDAGEEQSRSSRALGSVERHTRDVATDAAVEARGVVEQAVDRLHEQANQQTAHVQQALERSGAQLEALADGRVEEAGPMADYARRAADRVNDAAGRVAGLGFDGMVSEVSGYARRRPGRFLLAAAAAGVVAGRLGRSARSASQDGQEGSGGPSPAGRALPEGGGQQRRPAGAPQVDLLPEQQPGEVAGGGVESPAGVPPGFGTGPAPVSHEAGESRHE